MVWPHEGMIAPYASAVVWLRHISRLLPGPQQEMRETLQGKSPRSYCQARPFHNRPGIMHIPVRTLAGRVRPAAVLPERPAKRDDLDRSHVWGLRAPRTLFKHHSVLWQHRNVRGTEWKTHHLTVTFPTWQRWQWGTGLPFGVIHVNSSTIKLRELTY